MASRLGALLGRKAKPRLGANTLSPDQAKRALAQALEKQSERLRERSSEAVGVQLLGQATPATDWPKLLAYWERQNPAGVAGWPQRLDEGACALNLWPLAGGRTVRPTGRGEDVRKRQPKKLVCTPGLTIFDPRAGDAETALAIVCTTWMEDVGWTDFQALRVAPPILEIWADRGRLVSRSTCAFGLTWPY